MLVLLYHSRVLALLLAMIIFFSVELEEQVE
jgi:hypothetical protein